jgi:superfamily I DNA and/or RNA helicase
LDEAAQATEAKVLMGQQHCTHWIQIGDYCQLPPTVKNDFAKDRWMETSLFERLIIQQGMDVEFLDTQYRMHPALAIFPSSHFYAEKLLSGTEETECPGGFPWPTDRPIGIVHVSGRGCAEPVATTETAALRWNIPEPKSQLANTNRAQIDVVKDLVNGFILAGATLDEIVLLTPYKDQVILYEKEIKADASLSGMAVRTVDRCQGSEWDIVIFSTVRAGDDTLGHTRDRRRVNVAMTRARKGFILVCDVDRFKLDQHIWSAYLVANESCVVDVASLQAYFEKAGVPTVRQRKLEDSQRKLEDWMRENGDHG